MSSARPVQCLCAWVVRGTAERRRRFPAGRGPAAEAPSAGPARPPVGGPLLRPGPSPAPGSRAADGSRSGRAPARRCTHDWCRALVPPSPAGSRAEFKSGLSRLTAVRLFCPAISTRPRPSRLELSLLYFLPYSSMGDSKAAVGRWGGPQHSPHRHPGSLPASRWDRSSRSFPTVASPFSPQ